MLLTDIDWTTPQSMHALFSFGVALVLFNDMFENVNNESNLSMLRDLSKNSCDDVQVLSPMLSDHTAKYTFNLI